MKITDDTDLLIGEYVLGTLEREERRRLEEIAGREPTVAAAIMVWERRLAPLHELVVPVEPPEAVWPEIAARIAKTPQARRRREPGFHEVVRALAESHGADSAMALVRRLRRWRAFAVLAGALFAVTTAFFAAELLKLRSGAALPPPPPPAAATAPLVAVLRDAALPPPLVVAFDPAARTLTVRSVPATNLGNRSYAFWLLRPDQAPLPLGRLAGPGTLTLDPGLRLDEAVLKEAVIGASVERNDSSVDWPTAPILHRGRLE